MKHPREDALEEYAFQRLSQPELESIEEHLLICESCREKLQNIDEFLLAMKTLEPAPAHAAAGAPVGVRSKWWNAVSAWFTAWPGRAALAGAMVAVCAVAILVRPHSPDGPPVAVTLKSMRGGDPGFAAAAPARRRLALAVEVPDLSSCAQCRIDIVNTAGRSVWSGNAAIQEGQLCVAVPVVLDSGAYWVRLYKPGNSGNGPDREFSLRVR